MRSQGRQCWHGRKPQRRTKESVVPLVAQQMESWLPLQSVLSGRRHFIVDGVVA